MVLLFLFNLNFSTIYTEITWRIGNLSQEKPMLKKLTLNKLGDAGGLRFIPFIKNKFQFFSSLFFIKLRMKMGS